METEQASISYLIFHYEALMQRYARFILRNGIDTAGIVKEAFETYEGKYADAAPSQIRQLLQHEVLYACEYCSRWLMYAENRS
ncbi:MAG: hypothetical protein ABJA78_03370 [Ferruginibacter sp.]